MTVVDACNKAYLKASEKASPVKLAHQLIKRFGPLSSATAQQLQTATADQLELWTDRILDAPTSAAVLADH